ncbi:unnamed protein product [Diatraea saccharalis]|uniref:Carbohydrate kinase PfkB domain-containing protein n=1 Tax=Diatraea saccharalis TaxID=40085 RepID=A0A9N9QLL8_9NEOP|nr:unnamed protein product [Diatraea saccharalis]
MAYSLKTINKGLRPAWTFNRFWGSVQSPLVFSEEVLEAKSSNKPIVALESTIITHGMPYPKNLETAMEVENIIRDRGATPAIIAIIKGQLTIGLTENQLRNLAQARGVIKASRRDLAPILAAKLDGATTVAGTIIAAELADIPIFATGGLGGVHREGENTLDISADLNELGRSKTLVVCSGVKSILDIDRTLEYLETQGVCVCAFGKTADFPAFYTVRSGYRAPYHVETAEQAAQILNASHTVKLESGIVIAVPVPEQHAMDESVIEKAIDGALVEAKEKGIKGKEITPFVLAAVAKVTSGASLRANIALIKNNAKVGADIAVEFKKLKNVNNSNGGNIGFLGSSSANSRRHFHTSSATRNREIDNCEDWPFFRKPEDTQGDVLVIGGANMDRTYRVTEKNVELNGSTHPCTVDQSGGGVARNMAEALWRLRGGRVRLLTAIGDDADGQFIQNIIPDMLLDGCVIKGGRTATYAAVLDANGECLMGLGDMALHDHITIDSVNKHIEILEQSPLVILDGNAPQSTIQHVLQLCDKMQKPVFFEPTDQRKSVKPLNEAVRLTYATPNLSELKAMASLINPKLKINNINEIRDILQLCNIVSETVHFLIVTMGSKGVITVKNFTNCQLDVRFYPVEPLETLVNVSGAGDCFASGFIHGILTGQSQSSCIKLGFEAAKCALLSKNTIPQQFLLDNVNKKIHYTQLEINCTNVH